MSPAATEERFKTMLIAVILLSPGFAGVLYLDAGGYSAGNTLLAENVTIEQSPFTPTGVYNVSFLETGLPGGTEWFVNLTNGQQFSSAISTLNFTEPNGTYYYSVSTAYKSYKPSPLSGSFTVSGSSQSIYLTFSLVTYFVVFTESNLPSSTKWFVNLSNGQSFNGTATVISFVESNGTYSYIIAVGNKIYSPSPSAGQFVINGASLTKNIIFSKIQYRVVFTETGLPSYDSWYVNESGGTLVSSSNSTVSFSLTNGTYTFSVSTGDREYYPLPSSFTLRINGQGASESITFTLFTSVVSFSESGLPSGSKWFVNVSGPIVKNLSTTSSLISFNAPNGTYNYSVAGVSKIFGTHYPTGNFSVSGNPVSVGITFLRLYTVTFYEKGLPSGIDWYVNITDPASFNSSSTSLSFAEPNGTYHYLISVGNSSFEPNVSTSNGNFNVSGRSVIPAPQSSPIIFCALHTVTFTESRLPSGTIWYLNVSDLNFTSTESYSSYQKTISFPEKNGTYRYQVSTTDNLYRPSPFSGKLTVKGWPLNVSSVNVPITFYLVTYDVSFTETGLTYGTPWSVTLNNTTRQSLNSTVLFSESNGSYSYAIQGLSGFMTTMYTGNLTVKGSEISNSVTWREVIYQLEIVQTGISSGTHWSVTLQGKAFNGVDINIKLNSTGSSVVFSVPNGTYNYTITPPLGYSGTHLSGAISVQGQSTTAAAFLQAPNYTLTAMVLALLMAGLVTALYIMIKRDNRSMFRRDSKHAKKEGLFFGKKKE